MEILLLRKNDNNTSVLQVFVSVQGNAGQICGDLGDDKKSFLKKGTLKKNIGKYRYAEYIYCLVFRLMVS